MVFGPSVQWTAFQRRCAAGVVVAVAVLAVAAAPVVWAGSQDAPGDRGWWPAVCGIALLAAVGASLPLRREVSGAGYAVSCLAVAVLLTLALGTVFATAQANHAIRDRQHEPPGVTATVTNCRTTGRTVNAEGGGHATYGCVYHWSADGREFSEDRPVEKVYPDGHETRVWLDGGRMVTGRPSVLAIPLWIAAALAGLLGTVRFATALAWKAREEGLFGRPGGPGRSVGGGHG